MLGRLFGGESRAVRDPMWTAWGNGSDIIPASNTASGQTVTSSTAPQLLAVHGCSSLIADVIATMPRDVYRRRADGTQEEVAARPAWVDAPNSETDAISFWVQSILSLLYDGNLFWAPTRSTRTGQVAEVYVLDPCKVQIRRDRPGQPVYYLVDGLPYPGEIVHVPGIIMPGCYRGVNPIEAARQAIGIGLGAQEYAGRFWGQGQQLSGVIELPGEANRDEVKLMKDNWVRYHGGSQRAHLPGVLTGGAKWNPISITNEQAQFLETRRFTSTEIASLLYRVPPDMVGLAVEGSSLTYQNISDRWAELIRRACMPWMARVEAAATALLARPQYFKFNADVYLRADTKTRYETHQIGIDAGFLLKSEAREIEDLPPVDGIDNQPTQPPVPAAPTQQGMQQ